MESLSKVKLSFDLAPVEVVISQRHHWCPVGFKRGFNSEMALSSGCTLVFLVEVRLRDNNTGACGWRLFVRTDGLLCFTWNHATQSGADSLMTCKRIKRRVPKFVAM